MRSATGFTQSTETATMSVCDLDEPMPVPFVGKALSKVVLTLKTTELWFSMVSHTDEDHRQLVFAND